MSGSEREAVAAEFAGEAPQRRHPVPRPVIGWQAPGIRRRDKISIGFVQFCRKLSEDALSLLRRMNRVRNKKNSFLSRNKNRKNSVLMVSV